MEVIVDEEYVRRLQSSPTGCLVSSAMLFAICRPYAGVICGLPEISCPESIFPSQMRCQGVSNQISSFLTTNAAIDLSLIVQQNGTSA